MVKRILQFVGILLAVLLVASGVLWVMGGKTFIHQAQVPTSATPAEVFTHVTQSELIPQWADKVSRVEPLTEGGHKVGAKAKIVVVENGKEFVFYDEVTASEQDQFVATHITSDMFTADNRITINEENGGVLVRSNLAVKYSGVWRLLAPFMEGAVQEKVEGDLERLKKLLEKTAE